MNDIIKKVIICILILNVSFATACDETTISDEKTIDINSNAYDNFIKLYDNDIIKPIPVEFNAGYIYYDNKPIYRNIDDANLDNFVFLNILNNNFLIKKEVNIDKYKIKSSSYNTSVQNAIDAVDGLLWNKKDNVDKAFFDIINEANLYSVSAIGDKYIRVFDETGVKQYCEEQANNTWINVVGVTSIDNKLLIDINKEIMDEVVSLDSSVIKISTDIVSNDTEILEIENDDENFEDSEELNGENSNKNNGIDIDKKDRAIINVSKEKYYKYFIKRDNKNHYVNYFSDSDYVVKDGFVVPSDEQVKYIDNLSAQDIYDYTCIEYEVFKLNNINSQIVKNIHNCPMLIYKKGDFLENGMPAWVNRNLNAKTTDIFGRDLYADCSKTIDGYQMFCGGTDTAFHGWKFKKIENADENYNNVVQNNAKWNDKYFVDVEVEYFGVPNDTTNYALNIDILGEN